MVTGSFGYSDPENGERTVPLGTGAVKSQGASRFPKISDQPSPIGDLEYSFCIILINGAGNDKDSAQGCYKLPIGDG
jgi:hypothetical protein